MRRKKKKLNIKKSATANPDKVRPDNWRLKERKDIIEDKGKYRQKYPSNLYKYWVLGSIDDDQYMAGMQLYVDAVIGRVYSGLSAIDYKRLPSGSYRENLHFTDNQLYAHIRYNDAIRSRFISIPQRDIMIDICVFDFDKLYHEQKKQYYHGKATDLLDRGLTNLAFHYENYRKRRR